MTTTLFVGGTIRTGRAGERPHWVLVEEGRIVGVHSNGGPPAAGPHKPPPDELPAADRVVDLKGGAMTPGFCDAHVHLPATGLSEVGLDLRGSASAADVLDAVRERARSDGVLVGANFEDPGDGYITGADLDGVVGARPALLVRADMHSCIVSSALRRELELEEVEGVDRDAEGRPTGYLRERAAAEAFRWVEAHLAPRQRIDAIRAAAAKAYSRGVTTVHEMFVVEWRGWDAFDLFVEAIEPLALRVVTYLGTDDVDRVRALGLPRIGGDWFLDGSFGSHTAWLGEPYTEPPPSGSSSVGAAYREDEEVYGFFSSAQRAELQVGVHAIGDAAIEQCISTWEWVAAEVGIEPVRALGHRIEHFECASDDHIRRAAHLRLRASVQPAFDAYWGGRDGLYAQRIGWERAAHMNRFRTMSLTPGLIVGAGSDSTVTPLDPFLQMSALRSHHLSAERLDAEDALALHTAGAHALVGEDPPRGAIVPGAMADLVWLDRDPVAAPADELTQTEVLGTWIEGQRVWPPGEAESS